MLPPRYATKRNKNRRTHAAAFALTAESLGFELFEWQKHLAEVSLELKDDGSYHYNQVCFLMPRQNGKTVFASIRIAMELLKPNKICAFTSQDRGMARVKWQEHVDTILNSSLAKKVDKVIRANGREQLVMKNGSVYMITTPSAHSARGLSLDLAVIDEALTHRLEIISALLPTQITRVSPQLIICSNAGNKYSTMLSRMREMGHESIENPETHENYCFVEYAPYKDDFDHLDEHVWRQAIPTLDEEGRGVKIEMVRQAAATQTREQFCQEFLNVWAADAASTALSIEDWLTCQRDDIIITDPVVFGIDISPDRSIGSIGAASKNANYTPVEVIENRVNGGRWIVPRCVELAQKWKNSVFVIDQGSAASSLINELRYEKLEVLAVNGREYGRACASFYDAVKARELTHLQDERLAHAVEMAGKRKLGEMWAWARPQTETDITPLVAITLARWGAINAPIAPTIAIH